MKKFRDFESAREFVRSLNLKQWSEWNEYCKSGNKPDDIPKVPNQTYKKEWKGIQDWLGYTKIQFRSFKEAREFVRKLGLKNGKEWKEYYKSGEKPDDIPTAPWSNYKKEWKGIQDWLGYTKIQKFLPFKEAREFVRKLELKTGIEWDEYCKSGNKPDDIPSNPNNTYENKGWIDIKDWVGTEKRNFCSFKEAREFVRKLGLKNGKEWKEYCKSGNKPDDIPINPDQFYKNNEWKGVQDWLGYTKIQKFLPFKEAREFVRKLGLKNGKEWQEYCKSGNKPDDIPAAPWSTYEEWKK